MVTSEASLEEPTQLDRRFRGISGLELLLGAGIVIGHNIYHVVPNEVPILFLLGLLSMRLRNGRWSAIGFKRPQSWLVILLIALSAAVLRIVVGFVIEGVAAYYWPPINPPAGMESIAGNIRIALLTLLLVWTFAAFGEEVAYRGYLTTRGADAGGGSTASYWIATIVVSVLFGFGHYYKGPAGVLDSGVAGLIIGAAYLVAGRNLWAAVLTHGFIDTVAVVAAFFGSKN